MNKSRNERTNDWLCTYLNSQIQTCINDYECKHVNAQTHKRMNA